MPDKLTNAYAVTRAIPFDELMTAVDVAEDKLCSGQYSKARFNKGELHFEVQDHWIRTILTRRLPPQAKIDFPPGQIERHRIKWSTSDLEIEYRYLDIRLKEFITLNKPMSVSFSYGLDENSYLQSNPDGSISMWSWEGVEILAIEKPFATDNKGKRFELKYEVSDSSLILTGDLSGAVYPIVIDPTYTVKAGTLADSTSYNNKRSLARKSNGDLWCTYYGSDGTTQQIYCAYSTDGGQNWTEEAVTAATGTNHQYYPSIAIDSSGNVHVVWCGKGWGTNTTVNQIQYRKRTTSWQTQEAITDKTSHQYSPSIAIDSSDNVHVVWRGLGWGTNTGYYNIQYRKRTTSWQTQEAITDKDANQLSSSIAIDSSDNVHVVWYGLGWGTNTTIYNIQYQERTTSWQTQEAITDKTSHQYYPSIAIDSSDNVHVVWRGLGWGTNTTLINIQYRERTTSWQTQVGITDRAYAQGYPILIWALHPTVSTLKTNRPKTGYALVWSGQVVTGYQVEYFCSDDLSWDTAVTVYDETGKEQVILAAQGETETVARQETGKEQVILAVQGETDIQAMVEVGKEQTILGVLTATDIQAMVETGKEVPVLAVIGEADGWLYVETGKEQTILAVLGESDIQAMVETSKLQIVLAVLGESESLTLDETGKLQVMLGVLVSADIHTMSELGKEQLILAIAGEAETLVLDETAREQIILSVEGESETLALLETARLQVVLAVLDEADVQTMQELGITQIVLVVAGEVEAATYPELGRLQEILTLIDETDIQAIAEAREQIIKVVLTSADIQAMVESLEQLILAVVGKKEGRLLVSSRTTSPTRVLDAIREEGVERVLDSEIVT